MEIRLLLNITALDIGGANTKAVSLKIIDGLLYLDSAYSTYFPIWAKGKDNLGNQLKTCINSLSSPADLVAITMTAELSDVYNDKQAGVLHILNSVGKAFKDVETLFLTNENNLVSPEQVYSDPLKVAGANWVATAWLASKIIKNCIVVDVGSTTTDIIPIVNHQIVAKGKNDLERLQLGELIYTGALRTNLATLVNKVLINNISTRVSSELFSTTGDIHLILGNISSSDYNIDTSDGRGKSLDESYSRLARLVCSDLETINQKTLKNLAEFIYQKQISLIASGINQIINSISNNSDETYPVLSLGFGKKFLGSSAASKLDLNVLYLENLLNLPSNVPETVLGLGWFAASKKEKVVPQWMQ